MPAIIRLALVLASVVIIAACAPQWSQADEKPKDSLIAPQNFTLADAKVEKGMLIVEYTTYVYKKEPMGYALDVTMITLKLHLKKTKITDIDGKPIPDEKLAERLKEMSPVVLIQTPVVKKYRSLFHEKTIFVEPLPPDLKPAGPVVPSVIPENPV